MKYTFVLIALFSQVALAQAPAMESTLDTLTVTPDLDKQSSPLVHSNSADYREGEELRRNVSPSLRNAVEGSPNVEFAAGPRAQVQQPIIRGLNAQRILILEDGVRQNFSNGHSGRAFGDYTLLENVEVVKGPWSSLYGSGAMGGVIALRRATAADFVRRTGRDQGAELALDGGSAASSFGQRATGFKKQGAFEQLLSVRHAKGSDIRLGDGKKLQYSASETLDYYAAVTMRPSEKQNFTLKVNRFEDRANVPRNPGLATGATNPAADYFAKKEDIIGEYNLAGSSWDFHAKPFFRRTNVEKSGASMTAPSGSRDNQIVDTAGIDTWNNWRASLSESSKLVLTTGFEFFHDRNDGKRDGDNLDSFPDGTGDQLGIYVQPTFTIGKLTLIPGVRYDSFTMNDMSAGGRKNTGSRTSWKGHGDYEWSEGKHVYLSWGQAYNAPRLQDLYITDMHFPGNFFVANPDLKPERAETWEAGVNNKVRVADGLLTTNAAVFRTETFDFIDRSVTATTTQFRNLDRVRLEGIELSAMYTRALWGAGLGYGTTRSRDLSNGQPLTDTPADQVSATLQFYPSDAWTIGTQARQAFKQTRVPTGTETSPAYFVEDFFVSYQPGHWDVRLRIDNAFDRDYRPHTSPIKSAGRDARLTVGYLF